MKFHIITLFPEMFSALEYGILGRARGKNLITWELWNPRNYANNSHRKIDDASYGGGPGMIMKAEPLQRTIAAVRQKTSGIDQLIHMTPQGTLLDNNLVKELASKDTLTLVAGRYEGIDERLMELEPGLEISIGNYVISGGELAAMVLIDAISRQLPGVIGDREAANNDSFAQELLDHPHYTRPKTVDNLGVPEVLLGGNHEQIKRWRRKQALGRTWLRRNDIMQKIELTEMDIMLLNEFIKESS